MTTYDVAFIGTGPDPENPDWGNSAAMAYRHARGYDAIDRCRLVACADLVPENAKAFADEFDIDRDRVFEDYAAMLRDVEPDVVSIATPVPTHADLVIGSVRTGVPEAIHCEKPMATTWSDARRMAEVCDRHDVQLTFNHQNRFSAANRRAKALLDEGAIGDLERLEMGAMNVFDTGTHVIDLCNYFNGERGGEWVLGAVDYRDEDVRYGAHNENQSLALWAYGNDVYGLASTGDGSDLVDARIRAVGTEGVIETYPRSVEADLRIGGPGDWELIECEDVDIYSRAVEHVIESLDAGVEPELSAAGALRSTEIIFGCYESVRRRGRVEFPLEIDDNPLEAMVGDGIYDPT